MGYFLICKVTLLQLGNKELSFQGGDQIGNLSELAYLKDL